MLTRKQLLLAEENQITRTQLNAAVLKNSENIAYCIDDNDVEHKMTYDGIFRLFVDDEEVDSTPSTDNAVKMWNNHLTGGNDLKEEISVLRSITTGVPIQPKRKKPKSQSDREKLKTMKSAYKAQVKAEKEAKEKEKAEKAQASA